MTTTRLLALLIALVGYGRASRAADVVAAPLDADSIAQMQASSLLAGQRLAPGDVLLANSSFQAVVFAQPDKGDQGRVGRVLFLSPTPAQETFVFESGPINDWERGELGRGDQLALVRFQRQSKDWSAELVVQMPERTSWLEVTTTIRNTGQHTLELPMVDVVRGPSSARAADDKKGMVAIGKVDAPTLALLRTNGSTTAAQAARGEWFLGHPSSDPRTNAVARAGKRLFSFGKTESVSPVPADEAWSADLKDRKHWHRIPAGQTRTVHRRLVFGPTGASVRPTLAVAARTAPPTLQFVPAGKKADAAPRSFADRARSLVGRSPTAAPSAPPPAATPIPTPVPPSMTVVAKPTAEVKIPSGPKPTEAAAAPVKAKPVEEMPKVITDTINQIGDLPPPIK